MSRSELLVVPEVAVRLAEAQAQQLQIAPKITELLSLLLQPTTPYFTSHAHSENQDSNCSVFTFMGFKDPDELNLLKFKPEFNSNQGALE